MDQFAKYIQMAPKQFIFPMETFNTKLKNLWYFIRFILYMKLIFHANRDVISSTVMSKSNIPMDVNKLNILTGEFDSRTNVEILFMTVQINCLLDKL